MKPAKKEELRKEIKEICELMLRVQISLQIVEYLMTSKLRPEKNIIRWNGFLMLSQDINWRMAVIELSKLLRDREGEKYNFPKFLRKLKADGNFSQANIPQTLIDQWENTLLNEQSTINNLIDLRDKSYAHKSNFRFPSELSFHKTVNLLKTMQLIIVQIRSIIFEETYLFENASEPVDDLKFIIKKLLDRDQYYKEMESQFSLT